ncbi:MAG TPA: Fur family transcriptional regulator [Longimicrobium sp.]|nr:Fur family transcriptional regulator [Longimicrobium sp.]
MANVANEILQLIARGGHRVTGPRRRVVEALSACAAPVSARDLHASLGAEDTDLVTVYRTLRWLVDLGLARTVVAGAGAELFELVPADRHSHHLHCDRCGAIRTVAVCGLDRAVLERIERDFGFSVDHHRLTFHGVCAECRAARE